MTSDRLTDDDRLITLEMEIGELRAENAKLVVALEKLVYDNTARRFSSGSLSWARRELARVKGVQGD